MTRDEGRAIEHDCARLVAQHANLNDAAAWEDVTALSLSDDVMKVGAFHDRFVLTPAGWRFAERQGSLTL